MVVKVGAGAYCSKANCFITRLYIALILVLFSVAIKLGDLWNRQSLKIRYVSLILKTRLE